MPSKDKIKERDRLKAWVEEANLLDQRVVFTNGCFDILHLGHIDYLEKAKNLGDKLVVGLNSDQSVRELKGPERPINSEKARSRMLAALEFVDAVCIFNEETPKELIENIRPNILVKGGDYTIDTIVGAEFVMRNGGEVKTIDLVKGYSTTNIIEKFKN
jgi:rfaE bifunctional protein nucleotidyltransferase chain/domain